MSFGISVLFRLVPLVMGIICLWLGWVVLDLNKGADTFVAGHVLISLTAICYALFTTASVIIQQLIGSFNRVWMVLWPATGYLAAAAAITWGLRLIGSSPAADHFVAGHVVVGVGMIAACVSTVAAASSHFTLIPKNAASDAPAGVPAHAYSAQAGRVLIAVPVVLSAIGVIWALGLLLSAQKPPHFVAGNV